MPFNRGANSPTPIEAGSRTARGLTHAVFNVRVSGKSNGFRLDEDDRRRRPNSGDAIASDGFSPWRVRLTIWRGAQAPHGRRISAPRTCKLVGRWRIVEADVS